MNTLFVLVFKASLLYYPGGSICQSIFICQVLFTSIQGIYAVLMRGSSAKVGLSAKFGIVAFKASILDSLGGGSMGQSRFVCQVLCTSLQGIYAVLMGGSIVQSRFICQVWCSGIQGIYSGFTGRRVHWPKKVYLPDMNTLLNLFLLHRGLFVLHMKDQ